MREEKFKEQWKVGPDGDGKFAALFLTEYSNGVWSKAISGRTREEAQAHVDYALRTNAERDEKHELIKHLLNKGNWKLPTKSATILDDAELVNRMVEALTYFLGGAEVTYNKTDLTMTVQSKGYYHYIGA